ncbi:NAD-dependent epimerase/dehydratase family protein [Rothia dentocariosa]|uniref:NAD-dependent epimerase/dehydratase family protein n=1 Tax=Rothia dentocariosa TaxID=2047 RepID=UPI00204243AA|nr:NAD-dependent epimerase/dehydratase family protein [Rothia dentocariosa]MCM3438675.1 NAD-dependent epimerase/dehydratase family protein [Rothia dentocariosa]
MATPAPLAARYTDPAPRSLRPVDESYFAARSGERVLITGASGMLGRETAIALLRAGYDVRVFQRSDAGIAALLPNTIRPRFEQIRGSLNNAEVIEQALVGVDGIVHAAAKVSVSGDWEDYERTNIVGTQALLDAAIERSISKFLYVSSPSVAHAGTALIGEGNGAASPEHARGNYARSKATAELAVLAANGTKLASGSTMRVGALRPHLIWGPGDTQLVERILDRARSGRLPLLSGGTGLIDTLYIDNAADALVRGYERLESIAGRALVVTNGQPRTIAELLSGFCTAVGVPAPRFSVPAPAAAFAGRLIEKVWGRLPKSVTAGDEPPMTEFLAEQLSTAHWFDQRLTRELLQWEPAVTIDEGYRRLGLFYGDKYSRSSSAV